MFNICFFLSYSLYFLSHLSSNIYLYHFFSMVQYFFDCFIIRCCLFYFLIVLQMKDKVQFILFVNVADGQFYSFSPSKGLIAKEEDVPRRILSAAQRQLQELRLCMDGYEFATLSSFQRRPIPQNLLIERKFKYPVYYTEQYLPASTIESYRVSETGQIAKDALVDYISARIYLGELKRQLQRSKKGTSPDYVTIDVKLIASVNEVIRTINRVLLQDYGVVITMRNAINKLIFKVKDKNEYLYGNESIVNFQFIRESLHERPQIDLEILEVSIYDKEQFQRYIFHRAAEDLARGEFTAFPWEDFLAKRPPSGTEAHDLQFLIWHLPQDHFQHPESTVEIEKLYSTDQLVRTNEKVKLKLEERKRLQLKKIPRFLWKERIGDFLQKRKGELKNRYVEIEGGVIYSGECFFELEVQLLAISGVLSLLREKEEPYGDKMVHKKFLRFQSKEMMSQVGIESRLPSVVSRYMQFMAKKRKNEVQVLPFMMNLTIQLVVGSRILANLESRSVIADHAQAFAERLKWDKITLARLPMETSIVFKLNIYAKEGDGFTYGVGALKLFDENGFLVQGRQQVQMQGLERMELFKIGCIDKRIDDGTETTVPCLVSVQLPRFKNNVIWTLSDLTCAKLLGYLPQIKDDKAKIDNNLERLNQLLRFDSLAIHHYSEADKALLRQCKKYYRHQSDKLVNYLYAIDWTDPLQIADVYTTLGEWQPLKPIQALFLLSPALADERVRYYAVKRMESFLDYEWVLYANQITQALVSFETDTNPLIELVLEKCVHEPYSIAQEYFWQFKNRVDEQFTAYRFNQYLESLLMLTSFRSEFAQQVRTNNYLVQMNEALIRDTEQLTYFRDKNKKFQSTLAAVESRFNQLCPGGFNFPIRPQSVFRVFKKEECKMYDSKKLPFALSCIPYEGYRGEPFRVMFKYGDDIKQDSLVLQMFRVFDKLWRESGLDFRMNIYRTLSTGTEIGLIEIVDAENNSKIHKDYAKGLVDAFDERTTAVFLEDKNPDKKELAIAKENYLRSSAGYLVATYVMGIGDRHSGNVMVQKNGKFFHIDFGHILGNFKMKFGVKRERTPVLFTSEFLYVMGGPDSKQFVRFQDYCSKAFNILRKNAYLIINLLAMMVSAEIPQLKSLQDIEYVTEKLALELSDAQAAEKLVITIKETLLSEKSRIVDNAFHEANRDG